MTQASTPLLLVNSDETCFMYVELITTPYRWRCAQTSDPHEIAEFTVELAPAAILLDMRDGRGAAHVAAVRQLPVPFNGTPIITLGGDGALRAGAGGHLDLPLSEPALLALLREWGGPLEDHTLRRAPWNFHYRLIRLLGLTAADATLDRLAQALRQAVEEATETNARIPAHRLAGIAGICGFAELSRLWARVDRGEGEAFASAMETSRSVIAQIERTQRTGPG
jgi:hypothetical protein